MAIHCIYVSGTNSDVVTNWHFTLNNPIDHHGHKTYLWGGKNRGLAFSAIKSGDIVLFANQGSSEYLNGDPAPIGGIGRVLPNIPVTLTYRKVYICVAATNEYQDVFFLALRNK